MQCCVVDTGFSNRCFVYIISSQITWYIATVYIANLYRSHQYDIIHVPVLGKCTWGQLFLLELQ